MQLNNGDMRDSSDTRIGTLLLVGLLCSIATMGAGTAVSLVQGTALPAHVLPLDKVVPAVTVGNGPALIGLGILILFATPFLGVLAALLEFARQRDGSFTVMTFILLFLLCSGFVVALR